MDWELDTNKESGPKKINAYPKANDLKIKYLTAIQIIY